MSKGFQTQKVLNDAIDEIVELEEPEEVLQERKIRNRPVDVEVNVSDDSQNYLPTPRDDMSDDKNEGESFRDDPADSEHFNRESSTGFFKKNALQDTKLSVQPHEKFVPLPAKKSKVLEQLSSLNIDPETRKIFSFITEFEPKTVEIPTKLKPFIPEYIPAVGEVEAFLKPQRPDAKEELLGLERIDEFSYQTGAEPQQKKLPGSSHQRILPGQNKRAQARSPLYPKRSGKQKAGAGLDPRRGGSPEAKSGAHGALLQADALDRLPYAGLRA